MRDATIPPTLEEHRLRERNARLVAALTEAQKYMIDAPMMLGLLLVKPSSSL